MSNRTRCRVQQSPREGTRAYHVRAPGQLSRDVGCPLRKLQLTQNDGLVDSHVVANKMYHPFAAIWVNPVCRKEQYEIQTRQEVQEVFYELVGEDRCQSASERRVSLEIMPCKVCGKTGAAKRCARCMNGVVITSR